MNADNSEVMQGNGYEIYAQIYDPLPRRKSVPPVSGRRDVIGTRACALIHREMDGHEEVLLIRETSLDDIIAQEKYQGDKSLGGDVEFGKDHSIYLGLKREMKEEGKFGQMYKIDNDSFMPIGVWFTKKKAFPFYIGQLKNWPRAGRTNKFIPFARNKRKNPRQEYMSVIKYVRPDRLDEALESGAVTLHPQTVHAIKEFAKLSKPEKLMFEKKDLADIVGDLAPEQVDENQNIVIPPALRKAVADKVRNIDRKFIEEYMNSCRVYICFEKSDRPTYAKRIVYSKLFMFEDRLKIKYKSEAASPEEVRQSVRDFAKKNFLENFAAILLRESLERYIVHTEAA